MTRIIGSPPVPQRRIEDRIEQLASELATRAVTVDDLLLLNQAVGELRHQRRLLTQVFDGLAPYLGRSTAQDAPGAAIAVVPDPRHPRKTGACPDCGGPLHETPLVRACRNQRCGWRE